MENIVYNHRVYCNKCEDYTIHKTVYKGEKDSEKYFESLTETNETLICDTCHTQILELQTDISLIDEKKVLLQRERFKDFRSKRFQELTSNYLNPPNILHEFFDTPILSKTIIIEDDAGLLEIEHKEKVDQEKKLDIIRQELEKYKSVKRNEQCLCGSGKKYKQCHLKVHQEYKIKF